MHGHVSDRRGESLRIQDGLVVGERREGRLCAEQLLSLVCMRQTWEALQKVTSGDAPIFVKGRQENPESSIVVTMLSFTARQFDCETCIAAVSLGWQTKRPGVVSLALQEKDGSPQCPMHVQYMAFAV